MGWLEEALDASQEAVAMRRELAAARPDRFRPDLARALSVLAHVVGALGRPEEELAARQEAVTILRELAVAHPEEFRLALATSLAGLSVELEGSGRREEALAASQEAAGVYRELAAARPEEFRDDLVTSLNKLSVRLRATGMRIGELLDLELDCVHEVPGAGAWLKVPLGKLDTERMVPIDEETLALLDEITGHRSPGRPLPHPRTGKLADFLLTHQGRRVSACTLRRAAPGRRRGRDPRRHAPPAHAYSLCLVTVLRLPPEPRGSCDFRLRRAVSCFYGSGS